MFAAIPHHTIEPPHKHQVDYQVCVDQVTPDYMEEYFLFVQDVPSKRDVLITWIVQSIDELGINLPAFVQSLEVINHLRDSQLEDLSIEDIYASSYKTLIFEWKRGADVFSLEIGDDTIGYFAEKDGKDLLFEDGAPLDEIKSKLIADLEAFLQA
jgi:hypothetical protein